MKVDGVGNGVLEYEPPVMSYGREDVQTACSLVFLRVLRQLAGPHQSQIDYAKAATETAKSLRGLPLISYSIATADYCLFDEMRPDQYSKELLVSNYLWTDPAARYQRCFAYQCFFPSAVFEAIDLKIKVRVRHLLVGLPAHVANRYDGIGLAGMLTPRLAYWVNSTEPTPPIGVSRQEFFAELLRCGVNPLSGFKALNQHRKVLRGGEPRYIRRERRLIPLRRNASRAGLRLVEARSARHWGRLLGQHEGVSDTDAILFSSGTAANESVIGALSRVATGPHYTHPYWYFENTQSIQKSFVEAVDHCESASVAFLNLEPVTYHNLGRDSAVIEPLDVVRRFVAKAKGNPEKRFFVVLDLTQDPLACLKNLLSGPLPPNLTVVKTVSVTKHQRGARNYFFGAAFVINDAALEGGTLTDLVREERDLQGGTLLDGPILHFPRPTAGWLQRKRERIADSNGALVRLVPVESGWQLTPGTFLSFLLPPVSLVEEIHRHIHSLAERHENEKIIKICRKIDDLMASALTADGHYSRYPDIECGNSFGLSETRILYGGGLLKIGEAVMGIGCVRISPGFETDQRRLCAYVEEMFDRFRIAMERTPALLGQWQARNLVSDLVAVTDETRSRFTYPVSTSCMSIKSNHSQTYREKLRQTTLPDWADRYVSMFSFAKRYAEDYAGPRLLFSRAVLRERMRFLAGLENRYGAMFLMAVKSGPHPSLLELSRSHLSGFDVSNHNEYSLLADSLDSKAVFLTAPTLPGGLNDFLSKGNELCVMLESREQFKQLIENKQPLDFGLRLDSVSLLKRTDRNDGMSYPGSRFGFSVRDVPLLGSILAASSKHRFRGFQIHHGGEQNTFQTYVTLAEETMRLTSELSVELEYLDLGGGLHTLGFDDLESLLLRLREIVPSETRLVFEPGRFLTQHAGCAVARVESISLRDGATNCAIDLSKDCHLRWSSPELIVPEQRNAPDTVVKIFGPTCAEGDFLGQFSFQMWGGRKSLFQPGNLLLFGNVTGYSVAWNTGFNGVAPAGTVFLD